GVGGAEWTASEVRAFCETLRRGVSGSLAVSTFPMIDWHEPDVMAPAKRFADAFAPQIYWFNFPNSRMVSEFHRPDGSRYLVNLASEYAELCLDRWRSFLGSDNKPIVMTGQAYWGEGSFTKEQAQSKMLSFLNQWSGHSRIAGLNWWHFGGNQ